MQEYKVIYSYIGHDEIQLDLLVKANDEFQARDLATVELKNKMSSPFTILAVELDGKVVL